MSRLSVFLDLPELYALQEQIKNHPAKRKVVAAGRRGGKTLLCADIATETAIEGGRVHITSTSQDQADVFWEYITGLREYDWFAPFVEVKKAYKNESRRILRLATGGVITVKTGRDPDALRSKDADLLIIDEAAFMNPEAWEKTAQPILADRDGTALLASSPQGRGWFYHKFLLGQSGNDPYWQSWNFPSTANPFLSELALAQLAKDMSASSYRQEILAEFLEDEGAVFKGIRSASYPMPMPEPYEGLFYMGVDWGRTHDYTVCIVADANIGKVVDMVWFANMEFEAQLHRVIALARKWKTLYIIPEYNSIGGPQSEQLAKVANEISTLPKDDPERFDISVRPFTTTAVNKPRIIETLALAIEQKLISYPDHPRLMGELESFSLLSMNQYNKPTYGAPAGLHDDMVMALAILWSQILKVNQRYVM